MTWPIALCLLLVTRLDARSEIKASLLPGKSVINIIPKLVGYTEAVTPTSLVTVTPTSLVTPTSSVTSISFGTKAGSTQGATPWAEERATFASASDEAIDSAEFTMAYDTGSQDTPDPRHTVVHAGLPRNLSVYPLALADSYHELKFNVSWQHSLGPPARDYSIEIRSVTDTVDCRTAMCYEYNIPGNVLWWEVPANPNPVAETCAVRPGCAYNVRLIAHPWDGHTTANLFVELDECVAGVCSCAHSPRLPAPEVSAHTVSLLGDIFVNITWVTPAPQYPQRLPPGLKRHQYAVSIGKQMVSNAHPAPWFANTVSRFVDADGEVADRDGPRWMLLPVTERSGSSLRSGERTKPRNIVLDVRLLARVNLIDDRGCVGPAGNATAYDPVEASKISPGTYILWAVFGGTCVIAMGALIAASARVVKRVLNAFRPAPVSAPLEPLIRRPAWFPLQLRP